ncbi:MAG: septum formation protein Maf [Epulopiscium sp.]|jgi:septum formation protein|nr:septum formation protein Maf [Candidatus Epulonipiscium sp.]
MQRLILATSVLSRRDLLKQLEIPFEEINCNIIEKEVDMENEYSPYEWVKAISSTKAHAVLNQVEGEAIIIGADTIVTMIGRILHRPKNREECISMLTQLQGKKHTVYTGLSVIYKHADGTYEEESYVDGADVYMNHLSPKIIEAYADTDEPYDKAGGYAIHGKGALLIDTIYGDFFTVAGLPLRLFNKSLYKRGIDLVDFWKK